MLMDKYESHFCVPEYDKYKETLRKFYEKENIPGTGSCQSQRFKCGSAAYFPAAARAGDSVGGNMAIAMTIMAKYRKDHRKLRQAGVDVTAVRIHRKIQE